MVVPNIHLYILINYALCVGVRGCIHIVYCAQEYNSSVESQKGVIVVRPDVLLRTKRVLLLYKVYGDSALLVLNSTSLNCNNALLALNWQIVGFEPEGHWHLCPFGNKMVVNFVHHWHCSSSQQHGMLWALSHIFKICIHTYIHIVVCLAEGRVCIEESWQCERCACSWQKDVNDKTPRS